MQLSQYEIKTNLIDDIAENIQEDTGHCRK